MKVFIAGGTGAIGRPLIAELLGRGHFVVALTRSREKAEALAEQGIEPAVADVFDADAVKAVVRRAQPEVAIEQLTALPKTYTRESMSAAAAFNRSIRLEGGANVLAAAQAAGVRRYLRQSIAFWAVPGPGLADEDTPMAVDASPAVAADIRVVAEIERRLLETSDIKGIALRYGFFYGPGTWFNPDGDVPGYGCKGKILSWRRKVLNGLNILLKVICPVKFINCMGCGGGIMCYPSKSIIVKISSTLKTFLIGNWPPMGI